MRIPALTLASSLIASLCITASTSASAQALHEQYTLAKQNDPNFKASVHRHQSVQEYTNIAAAAFRPVVSGNATQSFDIDNGSANDTYDASLALNLRLDAFYAADSSIASIQQSTLNLQASQQNLVAQVISNYFDVVKQQAHIDSISAQIRSAKQSLASIQKQSQLGLATQLQASNVENNVQQLHLSLLQTQQRLQQARNNLTASTGVPIDSNVPGIRLSTELPALDNLQLDHWWQQAQQHNLSLLAATAGVQKSYHDYQQTDSQKYPTGRISANHYSYKNDNVMLRISGNFYDGGLNKAQTQQARLNWMASQQNLTASQRSTKQQLHSTLYNLRNNSQQIQLQQSLLNTATISLAATQKEYELGVADLVAVLEAEQKVASNEVNLINARYDLLVYQSNLKQLAGSLDVPDLLLLDAMLD
ncbi:MAG TPA: hypothetical protein DE179_07035 [Oceanospirillaceae bacterium]|nr:hypothetical protein [Oceanospirillaceae bacterium]